MSELTSWEIGQEFISISDYIQERMSDVPVYKNEQIHKEMQRARAKLGDALDALESHDFGIYNGAQFRKEYRETL